MDYYSGTDGFLYAGDFYINTGYDDPAAGADNLASARELYAAQVFANAMNANPNVAGNPVEFRITATPTFGTTITPGIPYTVALSARVWLKCAVWVSPVTRTNTSSVDLTGVTWALYRL